jgi:hypothetical protein
VVIEGQDLRLRRAQRGSPTVDRVPQDILNDVRGRLAAFGINVIAVSCGSVGLQIEE